MRIVVLGAGAVGGRAARQLHSTLDVALDELAIVDQDQPRAQACADALGPPARARPSWTPADLGGVDVVVVALPSGHQAAAAAALEHGAHAVSVADDPDEVRGLLELDAEARERDKTIVVGAGFSPGLSCVLARHAAAGFDAVDEVHIASLGTGGPACAHRHHRALRANGVDWREGGWVRRAGGSGRELCWFPDPVGAQDCYRGGLSDPLVLAPAFPGVHRVTARLAASRRDRVTSRFPMLRRPHPEGLLGAVRVEVRGHRGQATGIKVLGVLDRPAVAAGAVAALAAMWAGEGRLARTGAAGLAELVPEPVPFLRELARRGIRAAAFQEDGG